jgi:16S rRNA (guanine527-N7)-methyltransferase
MELLAKGALHLGMELTETQLKSFQTYFEELVDWNNRINLTAITDYNEVQTRHFLDSLTVSVALPEPIPAGYKLIDVGSGGGFPGLPLKIAFPQIEMVLLEATNKKAEFLRHMIRRLSLTCADVVSLRAEEAAQMPEYRECFDAVVTRGLAEMSVLTELTLPFCRIGGRLVAQKKGAIAEEINASAKAIRVLGGSPAEIKTIDLPEFNDNRCLIVVEKISSTPPQFPRRPGQPARKPIT